MTKTQKIMLLVLLAFLFIAMQVLINNLALKAEMLGFYTYGMEGTSSFYILVQCACLVTTGYLWGSPSVPERKVG